MKGNPVLAGVHNEKEHPTTEEQCWLNQAFKPAFA